MSFTDVKITAAWTDPRYVMGIRAADARKMTDGKLGLDSNVCGMENNVEFRNNLSSMTYKIVIKGKIYVSHGRTNHPVPTGNKNTFSPCLDTRHESTGTLPISETKFSGSTTVTVKTFAKMVNH